VTKETDEADGPCDVDCSLREAIIAANASPGKDTIILPSGTYTLSISGTQGTEAGDLDIYDDLALIGTGPTCTIIDANEFGDRVFETFSGTVEISKVTIRGGNPTSYLGGGGIYNTTTLTLDTVVISDNEVVPGYSEPLTCGSPNAGGGISSYLGSLTLLNSTVTGNTANGSGSDGGGGGIAKRYGSLTITSSIIAGNSGGGILTACGDDIIIKSVISDNTGTGGVAEFGSGIRVGINGGTLIVSQSTISGNSNYGVVNGGGTVSIVESTVSGNCTEMTCSAGGGVLQLGYYSYPTVAGWMSVANSTVSGNGHQYLGSGGGARLNVGYLSITSSTITNNSVAVGFPDNAAGVVVPPADTPPRAFLTTLHSTIIASNSGADCNRDFGVTGYHNLSSDTSCGFTGAGDLQSTNPLLGALQDNGGPTLTHALSSGSPAINGGQAAECPDTDQRLAPRGASCDIGSYERNATPPPLPPTPPPPCHIFTDGFESGDSSQWSVTVPS
jgi:CSLREA domain-containing protein